MPGNSSPTSILVKNHAAVRSSNANPGPAVCRVVAELADFFSFAPIRGDFLVDAKTPFQSSIVDVAFCDYSIQPKLEYNAILYKFRKLTMADAASFHNILDSF
jgi:hypothetical protein